MNRKYGIFTVLALILVGFIPAQDITPSALKPLADGSIKAGEYSFSGTYAGMKLSTSISTDRKTLYLALEAPSTGWVSIGLGSPRMDGAFMVLAAVENGKSSFSEQTGSGHGHRPNKVNILTASAASEAGGKTVLEIALPAQGFIKDNSVQVLLSYGPADSFMVKHSSYVSVELSVRP